MPNAKARLGQILARYKTCISHISSPHLLNPSTIAYVKDGALLIGMGMTSRVNVQRSCPLLKHVIFGLDTTGAMASEAFFPIAV